MTVVAQITETAGLAQTGICGIVTGANLRTPCGDRRIENVRAGDMIVTRDGGLQPVRVIWSRTVSAAEIAADPSLAPVTIPRREIAPMMPKRDIRVGAAHRLLVPGWRIENMDDRASCLVGAREIAAGEAGQGWSGGDVTYYNVVFDRHHIFAIDGLPVESFHPCPATMQGMAPDVTERITEAFPELLRSPSAYPPAEYPAPEKPHFLAIVA